MTPDDMLPKIDVRYAYELPESIVDSPHWHATDAERSYVIRIPPLGLIEQVIRSGIEVRDLAKSSVISAGGYPDIDEWWDRLSPKAQMLICDEFVLCYTPSADERRDHRKSRRKL